MTERLGAITLLIVSVICLVILGDSISYNAGLIPLVIYTMGVLSFCGAVYTLLKRWGVAFDYLGI